MSKYTEDKLETKEETDLHIGIYPEDSADCLAIVWNDSNFDAEANAAELVRRWNAFEEGGSHKALVEALKGMVEDAKMLQEDEAICACQCLAKAPDDLTNPPPCNYCKAKAALAAAQPSSTEIK